MTLDPDTAYESCSLCDGHGTIDGYRCVNCEGEGVVAHECDEDEPSPS